MTICFAYARGILTGKLSARADDHVGLYGSTKARATENPRWRGHVGRTSRKVVNGQNTSNEHNVATMSTHFHATLPLAPGPPVRARHWPLTIEATRSASGPRPLLVSRGDHGKVYGAC